MLREACAADRKLTARLIKARRQRDAAREEARQNVAEIVLSLTRALRHAESVKGKYAADCVETNTAVCKAEQLLRIRYHGDSHADRIERIAEIARRALHTALVAQGHERTRTLPHSGGESHFLEYMLTPEMVQFTHGDVLLHSTAERLMKRFQAEGYTSRAIVVRVQDFI